jgi:hypothetical protein
MGAKTHQEWLSKMNPLIRGGRQSLPGLRSLARELQRTLKTSVTFWHQQQTAFLVAQFLDESGDTASSARAFRSLARRNHQELMYYLQSTRSSLEAATELYERIGKKAVAAKLRRDLAALSEFQASREKELKNGGKRDA